MCFISYILPVMNIPKFWEKLSIKFLYNSDEAVPQLLQVKGVYGFHTHVLLMHITLHGVPNWAQGEGKKKLYYFFLLCIECQCEQLSAQRTT